MALPILDGNQTATTLSTVVSGGAHIPAHTVVSLGAQAITDMRSAVSGSVVSISNLPATQTIAGTVTANVPNLLINEPAVANGIQIFAFNENQNSSYALRSSDVDLGALKVEPISLPAISGTVTANVANSITVGSLPSISGTVTANVVNSITIGSLPVQLSTTTIGGTSRLNVTLSSATTVGGTAPSYGNLSGGSDGTNFRAILTDTSGRTVVTGTTSILGTPSITFGQIAGAVTMCGLNVNGGINILSASDINESPDQKSGYALLVKIMDNAGNQNVPLTNIQLRATAVTIAGTVTANNPNGTLTTRFGSVTTANTSQITTAVTNTSRKYLLAQNISSGTVTIGIGFSPTTTQGIQLTAGAGITFDSFCPTGAVYWLGATTGATFTILEG